MKRGILLLFFFGIFVLSLILILPFISGESVVTGSTVTGEATSQQFSMQIYVQLVVPYVYIRSPLNYTYRNETILIDYTIDNEDFIWYNIDNGENITLTGPRNITLSAGTHILYLYANNSNGERMVSSVFTANSSKLIILYDEFNDSEETYNFDPLTYEALSSVSDVVLEVPEHGKIQFRESIDVLEGLISGSNIVDLDSNIEISENYISLNSNNLPGLNKSAKLFLYGIDFENPRILKDGQVCPVTLCQIQSYNGNILEFNVNSFSTYTAQETPEGGSSYDDDDDGDTGGSGGGGGGIVYYTGEEPETEPEPEFFNTSTDKISVKLKQGETKEQTFEIWNLGEETLYFVINHFKTEDFLKISNKSFELAPGEKAEIVLDFLAKETLAPDLYIGKLSIETLTEEKEILIYMEVESSRALFDVKVEILRKYKKVDVGGKLIADIDLFNLGEVKRADVLIEYYIKDSEGNELLKREERLTVEEAISFLKEFKLPSSLAEGEYVLYVRVLYGDEVASSSAWFTIKEKSAIPWNTLLLYLLLFFILFVIIRLYKLYIKEQREEKVKKYEEEEERDEKRKELEKKKEKYLVFKTPEKKKPVIKKKKVVKKKKSGPRITPEGYIDLRDSI
jgi:hypothetical protein